MLTVYLDESGHEGKEFVVLSGFLGSEEQWEVCEREWLVALSPKKHLHMKDLRWNKENYVRSLLSRLGPVPHNAGLTAVVSALRVSDYDDLVSGRLVSKLMKGYYLAFIGVVDSILKNIPPEETVKVVLEVQGEYEIRTRIIFDNLANRKTPSGKPKLVSMAYIPKGTSVLTEPADYLSYALLNLYRDPDSLRSELCAPILQNQKNAYGMKFDDRAKIRAWIESTLAKFPTLMDDVETCDD